MNMLTILLLSLSAPTCLATPLSVLAGHPGGVVTLKILRLLEYGEGLSLPSSMRYEQIDKELSTRLRDHSPQQWRKLMEDIGGMDMHHTGPNERAWRVLNGIFTTYPEVEREYQTYFPELLQTIQRQAGEEKKKVPGWEILWNLFTPP